MELVNAGVRELAKLPGNVETILPINHKSSSTSSPSPSSLLLTTTTSSSTTTTPFLLENNQQTSIPIPITLQTPSIPRSHPTSTTLSSSSTTSSLPLPASGSGQSSTSTTTTINGKPQQPTPINIIQLPSSIQKTIPPIAQIPSIRTTSSSTILSTPKPFLHAFPPNHHQSKIKSKTTNTQPQSQPVLRPIVSNPPNNNHNNNSSSSSSTTTTTTIKPSSQSTTSTTTTPTPTSSTTSVEKPPLRIEDQKKNRLLSTLIQKMFAGTGNEDLVVDDMPLNNIRKLVARQMTMSIQLILQMLLMSDNSSDIDQQLTSSLLELNNLKDGKSFYC